MEKLVIIKSNMPAFYDVLPNTNEQQYELSDTDNEEVVDDEPSLSDIETEHIQVD